MVFSKSLALAVTLLASSLSLVSAVPVDRATTLVERKDAPADWWSGWEDYNVYHTRYKALDCKNQHNTPFFTNCCGPLRNNQALSTRPDECDPAKRAASSKTQQVDDSDDDDGENLGDDSEDCTEDTPAASPALPKSDAPKSEEFTGGHATFFYQNGNAGACGDKNPDSALIAAIDYRQWGSADWGQGSKQCGRKALVTNLNNGKQVEVTIADLCPTCDDRNSLDLSTGAFNAIARPEEGYVPIAWHFTS